MSLFRALTWIGVASIAAASWSESEERAQAEEARREAAQKVLEAQREAKQKDADGYSEPATAGVRAVLAQTEVHVDAQEDNSATDRKAVGVGAAQANGKAVLDAEADFDPYGPPRTVAERDPER